MSLKKLRILVADECKETIVMLTDFINGNDDMEIVATAEDGEDLCKKINRLRPDVVVMDLILPKLDGLEVLKSYSDKHDSPIFFVVSSVANSKITEETFKYGAKYYIMKPFKPEILYRRIQLIVQRDTQYSGTNETSAVYENRRQLRPSPRRMDEKTLIEYEITKVLHQIGIPSSIKGFKYIRDAVYMVLKDWEAITAVTKEIYPVIANKYYTSRANVERAIRHSLDIAWEKGSQEGKIRVFGKGFDFSQKMKNAEAIANLASRVEFILKEKGLTFEK